MSPEALLAFWFDKRSAKHWFRSTSDFDRQVRERFEPVWRSATSGELAHWETTAEGALALVILLDQFPLNMFRDLPEGYSSEPQSRAVAARAIERGFDTRLDDRYRAFFYLPFMHSEDLADQDRSVALFQAAGLDENLKWARHHREIVRRFGRFPHRNAILARQNTAEEEAWLDSPDAFKP